PGSARKRPAIRAARLSSLCQPQFRPFKSFRPVAARAFRSRRRKEADSEDLRCSRRRKEADSENLRCIRLVSSAARRIGHLAPRTGESETLTGTDSSWTVFFAREVLTTRALISMAERLVEDVLMLMFPCGLAL